MTGGTTPAFRSGDNYLDAILDIIRISADLMDIETADQLIEHYNATFQLAGLPLHVELSTNPTDTLRTVYDTDTETPC